MATEVKLPTGNIFSIHATSLCSISEIVELVSIIFLFDCLYQKQEGILTHFSIDQIDYFLFLYE